MEYFICIYEGKFCNEFLCRICKGNMDDNLSVIKRSHTWQHDRLGNKVEETKNEERRQKIGCGGKAGPIAPLSQRHLVFGQMFHHYHHHLTMVPVEL